MAKRISGLDQVILDDQGQPMTRVNGPATYDGTLADILVWGSSQDPLVAVEIALTLRHKPEAVLDNNQVEFVIAAIKRSATTVDIAKYRLIKKLEEAEQVE